MHTASFWNKFGTEEDEMIKQNSLWTNTNPFRFHQQQKIPFRTFIQWIRLDDLCGAYASFSSSSLFLFVVTFSHICHIPKVCVHKYYFRGFFILFCFVGLLFYSKISPFDLSYTSMECVFWWFWTSCIKCTTQVKKRDEENMNKTKKLKANQILIILRNNDLEVRFFLSFKKKKKKNFFFGETCGGTTPKRKSKLSTNTMIVKTKHLLSFFFLFNLLLYVLDQRRESKKIKKPKSFITRA